MEAGMKQSIICTWFILAGFSIFAQNPQNPQNVIGIDDEEFSPRVITTAVPFLMISPDARSAAMGDVGAATSPDANAMHWNPAKLAFLERKAGMSLSYTPWMGRIIEDMSISYLSGFTKLGREQTLAAELKYFDLGNIVFSTGQNQVLGQFNPRELVLGISYSRILIENALSLGINTRYIHSNLTGNVLLSGNPDAKPGQSIAADLGVFLNKDLILKGINANLAFGAVISNIGAKITYSTAQYEQFIPTNLRVGTAYTTHIDPYNSFTIAFDLNKLMVPTPPQYGLDSVSGNRIILNGKDPNRPLISGIFGSFTDAPGGFIEELQEVMISVGAEYWYNDVFAARAGYFHENEIKGDRKFLSFGLGLKYQVFGIDLAYLVPTENEHPLAETLRLSLVFGFNEWSS